MHANTNATTRSAATAGNRSIAIATMCFALLFGACDGLGEGEERPMEGIGNGSAAMEVWGIDLTITEVSGPTSMTPWSGFDAGVTVCNHGSDPSHGFEVVIVLSDDGTVGVPIDGSLPNLGSEWVDYLGSGECRTLDIWSHVNAGEGTYHLVAVADPWDSVSEANESNNVGDAGALAVGYDPDLTIASLQGPPSARPWDELAADVKVCNQGQSGTWSGSVQVLLSSDTEITMNDSLVGDTPLPSLMPGQCVEVTVSGNVNVPEGPHYLGAIVDGWNSVTELIEDNNDKLGVLMGIGDGPDLVVSALSGPAGVEPWNMIDAEISICNNGTAAASSGYVEFYLSDDDTITEQDEYAGGTSISQLEPGRCSTRPVQLNNNRDSGSFTIGAIAVYYGGGPEGSGELIDTNNTIAGNVVVVGSAPIS